MCLISGPWRNTNKLNENGKVFSPGSENSALGYSCISRYRCKGMDRIVRIPKTRSGHSLSADIKQDRFRHLHTVFLDRDGVINEKMPEGQYVTRREELRVLPGVGEAIRRLNSRGCRVILVSNQRGIALGLYTAADLEAIHAWLKNFLESHGARLDGIYYCPHDRDECDCRKPMPGMFE